MIIQKRIYPPTFKTKKNVITADIELLPFYIHRFGYCNDKKLEIGNENKLSDILVLYTLDGTVHFTKNKDTKCLVPNDVVISTCNVPLIFNRVNNYWSYFYMIINGTQSKLFYNMIRSHSNILPNNPLTLLLDHFIAIANLEFSEDILVQMHLCLLIHNVLFELYTNSHSIIEAKKLVPVHESEVNTAINYITKNIKSDLSVDAICNKVCFSKFYFCKIFKAHMGVSLHQYVTEYRVNKSKELLSYSKLSLNAIAAEVGFKSTLTYIRCFENAIHMTPTKYRNLF